MCIHIGVVIVSQWCGCRRDTDSCAHAQLKVSAVVAYVQALPKRVCTHKISLKTARLSSMANESANKFQTKFTPVVILEKVL